MFRMRTFALVLACLVACSGGSGSTGGGEPPEPTDQGLPRPTFRLVVATDLEGYLEPCGCQRRPLGGIDKLATALAEARADGTPTLFVHAGDLLFDGLEHSVRGADASAQEGWKAETLVEVLSRLGLAAATAGPLDARQGVPTLRRLAGAARFPLLAANLQFDGAPLHAEPVLLALGPLKVGVFGVSEPEAPNGAIPEGIAANGDLRAAAQTEARLVADPGLARGAFFIEGPTFALDGGLSRRLHWAPRDERPA